MLHWCWLWKNHLWSLLTIQITGPLRVWCTRSGALPRNLYFISSLCDSDTQISLGNHWFNVLLIRKCKFLKNSWITNIRIGRKILLLYESDQISRLKLFWFFCRLGSLWKQLSIGGRWDSWDFSLCALAFLPQGTVSWPFYYFLKYYYKYS